MENIDSFCLIEFFVFGDVFRQISLITKLQKDIEIRFGLFNINEVDDMVMFTVIEEIDFSFKDWDLMVLIEKNSTFNVIPWDDFDSNFGGVIGIAEIDMWEWSLAEKSVGDMKISNSFVFHLLGIKII